MNQSLATYEWFYQTEYLYACKQFLNKQTLLRILMAYRYLIVLMKKYIETKFPYKYIGIFFIFWNFESVTRIPIWIISLTIVWLNLFIYLICIAKELRFYLLLHFQHFESRILNVLTRSSDWIFNPMRYTGVIILLESTGINCTKSNTYKIISTLESNKIIKRLIPRHVKFW